VYGVTHEPWIVVLSILVAIQGSYVALGLTLKVARSEGVPRRLNLAAAAFTFAISIWSMHFIGILALRLPFQLDYLVLPTLLSFLVCVFVVGAAVYVASHAPVSRAAVPAAGAIMGLGIATMHYIGMLALHHSALMLHDPAHVVASFVVAIVASTLGLRFAFSPQAAPRQRLSVALAAVLFGLAISGMHYVAMAGLTLAPYGDHAGQYDAALSPDLLAVIVTVVAFAVSAVFLLTLGPDRGPVPAEARIPLPPVLAADPPALAESAPPRRPARALPVERDRATHYIPVESDPGNDMPALMQCLGATYLIASRAKSGEIAARAFYQGSFMTALKPGEMVTGIRIPVPPAGHGWAYEKLKRKIGDYATAAAAVVLVMQGGKVAQVAIGLTNVGDTPLFAEAAATILTGSTLDAATVNRAVAAAELITSPASDGRGPTEYRTRMAGVMLRRALARAAAR
jgi:NO-binding membrane sensor protein with MHYT domain